MLKEVPIWIRSENIKSLTPRQVADLLGHTTSEITELYYVKRDMKMLNGITDGFELLKSTRRQRNSDCNVCACMVELFLRRRCLYADSNCEK